MNTVSQQRRINEIRSDCQKACRAQLERILWASLEGDESKHLERMEALETTLTLLWRFDRKLQNVNTLIELAEAVGGTNA